MFLHPENQQLLWQTLQKSPYLIEFAQTFAGHREEWFRNMIEQFYTQWISQNKHVPTNAKELLEINKCAIQMMVSDLKRLLGLSQPILNASFDISPQNMTDERKRKEDNFSENYNRYQSEYNRLLERPSLPIKELPKESSDEKIMNIEELVKRHTQMREMDLAIHSSSPKPLKSQNGVSVERIKIMDEIHGVEIVEVPVQMKKQVHWEESSPNELVFS